MTTRGKSGWFEEALCAQIGPEVFFPSEYTDVNNSHRYDEARPVCAKCPVWRECLIEDLDVSEFEKTRGVEIIPDGMRGGLSPRERNMLIHRARRIVNRDNPESMTNRKRHDLVTDAAAEIIWQYSQKELQHLTRTHARARSLDTERAAG